MMLNVNTKIVYYSLAYKGLHKKYSHFSVNFFYNTSVVLQGRLRVPRRARSINIRYYSTSMKLNPFFVTGFIDAEGSFIVSVILDSAHKVGWAVKPAFVIGLHKKDLTLLEDLKSFFGGIGKVSVFKDSARFRVTSVQDLTKVIIPFLDNYSLITKKRADFELLKKTVDMLNCKEHRTIEGLHKIVAIKASINKGLSPQLTSVFSNIPKVSRPSVQSQIIDPNWVAGFASGDGGFLVRVVKSSTYNIGFQTSLLFSITQHSRDGELMQNLVSYLGCGAYFPRKNKDIGEYMVTKFSDIANKIIPFFDKYPILGVKSKDFSDFKQVALLFESKAHLTPEGIDKIRQIKTKMNRGRIID